MSNHHHEVKSVKAIIGSNQKRSKVAKTYKDKRCTLANRINNGMPLIGKFLCPNDMEINAFNVLTTNGSKAVCLNCNCNPYYKIVFYNNNDPISVVHSFNTDHNMRRNPNKYQKYLIDSDSESELDEDDFFPDSEYESNFGSDNGSDNDSESESESEIDYNEGYTMYYPSDSEEE